MEGKRRSPCPIANVLDVLGDRWTLLVVRDLACGKGLFKEFLASPEGIATNILADRLSRLVAQGLVEKRASARVPGREEYALTEKGRSLRPVLEAMACWGLEQIPGTEARMKLLP
jgi:DNA-binding HxlR family transcriptional regulator